MTDEMPPRWMWPLDEELNDWFEEIDRKRNEKFSSNNDDTDLGPMMSNDWSWDKD